jgi:hypothetical protein
MHVPGQPAWLSRIEMLGTTIVVLMIGGMVLWFKSGEREPRLAFVIGSALLIYAGGLVTLARRSDPAAVAWWPFALAGLVAGAAAELINAQLMMTRECAAAAVTGVVIGTAHWVALCTWLRLTGRPTAP